MAENDWGNWGKISPRNKWSSFTLLITGNWAHVVHVIPCKLLIFCRLGDRDRRFWPLGARRMFLYTLVLVQQLHIQKWGRRDQWDFVALGFTPQISLVLLMEKIFTTSCTNRDVQTNFKPSKPWYELRTSYQDVFHQHCSKKVTTHPLGNPPNQM